MIPNYLVKLSHWRNTTVSQKLAPLIKVSNLVFYPKICSNWVSQKVNNQEPIANKNKEIYHKEPMRTEGENRPIASSIGKHT